MEMIEYVKLVTAFIVSIGGSSVVIIALSKWFEISFQLDY